METEFDEKLVELLKMYPLLIFDETENPPEEAKKAVSWKTIGEKLGVSGNAAENRWNEIRKRCIELMVHIRTKELLIPFTNPAARSSPESKMKILRAIKANSSQGNQESFGGSSQSGAGENYCLLPIEKGEMANRGQKRASPPCGPSVANIPIINNAVANRPQNSVTPGNFNRSFPKFGQSLSQGSQETEKDLIGSYLRILELKVRRTPDKVAEDFLKKIIGRLDEYSQSHGY